MDKTSKRVMRYIESECNGTLNFLRIPIGDATEHIGISTQDLQQCLSFLEEDGYVTRLRTSSGNFCGVSLSHKGRNYRYFRRQQILAYVADKWIDFFALVSSVVAIIISVIAISKP